MKIFLRRLKLQKKKHYKEIRLYEIELQKFVSECNEKYVKGYLSEGSIRKLLIENKQPISTAMVLKNMALSTLKNNVEREIKKLRARKNTNFGNKRIMLKNSKRTKRKY